MTRIPRLLLGLVASIALAVGLSACGEDDVTQEQFTEDLQEQGVPAELADCVSERMFAALDQGQLNDYYSTDAGDELSSEQEEALTTASTECATEAAGGDTTETTEAEG